MSKLFEPVALGDRTLANRIAMAPMTRSRNPDGIANELNALYYRQRARAGLIVTEGTPISTLAEGFLYIPGLYTPAQVAGWRKVTDAVHEAVGTLFGPTSTAIPAGFLPKFRKAYSGTLILAGGMTRERAEEMIADGLIDIAAFGEPFISNPDLVERLHNGWPLTPADRSLHSGGGAHGYTDYPTYAEARSAA